MSEPTKQKIDIANLEQKDSFFNPFPGLRPFMIEESHLFFGREGQSDEVLLKLSENRFIGVIGPSGSGKSSFIYCGVLPILYGGFLTDTSADWEVVVARPGSDPIGNLAESLLKNDPFYEAADEDEQKIKKTIISTILKSSSQGLAEAILQFRKSTDKNYLILIDQFEELFRFKNQNDAHSTNETLAFINLLMSACDYAEVPIYVAITMRSDFIGECAQFPDLTKKINDSHYLIPQMTREQKRRAITGPVAVGGAEISPRLTQQLLNDLGDNPDQLPILQHALMRTWDYWSKFRDFEEEALDIKHYEAIGTMAEALSQHANEAYDELDEKQRFICESLFKAITEKRGENFGIRRPTPLGEIAEIADVKVADVITVVEKFREPGRSLLTPQAGIPLSADSMIDISHESLMRIWDRLKNWVNDESDAVQMYIRLAEAATMHQEGKTGLWRPPDLHLALNWHSKHKPTLVWGQRYHPAFERTLVFLENSKKEYEQEQLAKEQAQKRTLKRARQVALLMGAAAVVCVFFLIYAFIQQVAAEEQRVRAEEQATIAQEQEALAKIEKDNAEKAAEDAKKAQMEAEEAKTEADKQRQSAEYQRQQAELQKIEAEDARKVAELKEEEAEAAKNIAQERQREAEIAKAEADKLRFLAIANAMAIKSTQLTDAQQKGLLAKQAHAFFTKYDEYPYNPEIYNGLYYAGRSLGVNQFDPLQGHNKPVRKIALANSANAFYSTGDDGRILHWYRLNNAWVADTLVGARRATVIKSLIHPDGSNQLFTAGLIPGETNQNVLEIYDLNNPKIPPKHIGGLSSSLSKIINAGNDIYALDNGGKQIKKLEGQSFKVWKDSKVKMTDIVYHEDRNQIITAFENGSIHAMHLSGNQVDTLLTHSRSISSINAAANHLVYGDNGGGLYLVNLNNLSSSTELIGHSAMINNIQFSHNKGLMASASNDRTVRVWNLNEINKQPIILTDHEDWVWNIKFTHDDRYLISASSDQMVRAFPLAYDMMSDEICALLERNMTVDEWNTYVADDIPYEETCEINLAKE